MPSCAGSKAAGGHGTLTPLAANPRYFTGGDGRAAYLVGSHSWNNFQDMGKTTSPAPLDFDAYLAFLRAHHHNAFRLWKRELPTLCNWDNGVWNVSPFPWVRTGPGLASDGQPRFDLSRLDQTYFDRMRARVMAAAKAGMYVAVMLFGAYDLQYNRCPQDGFPLTGGNNINGVDDGYRSGAKGVDATTMSHPAVIQVEEAYVKKVIDTVNDLLNVLFEIANEAGDDSTAWQTHMIDLVHAYEATKPTRHPVGFTFQYSGGTNATLFDSKAEWISPGGSEGYGCTERPAPSTGQKVVLNDTDHSCSWSGLGGLGVDGQRRWAWQNFLAGNNLLFMDPYLIPWKGRNAPVDDRPDSAWDAFRDALGGTRILAERMNLAAMTPQPALSSTGFCLARVGGQYLVYQPTPGAPFAVTLAPKEYTYEWWNPQVNRAFATGTVVGTGAPQSFAAPFSGDAVLFLESAR